MTWWMVATFAVMFVLTFVAMLYVTGAILMLKKELEAHHVATQLVADRIGAVHKDIMGEIQKVEAAAAREKKRDHELSIALREALSMRTVH